MRSVDAIASIADRQRAFFRMGASRDLDFRARQLSYLRDAVTAREADLLAALGQDIGRPATEAYTAEIALVLHEIDVALKHLTSWARPRRIGSPLMIFPAASALHTEPYGSVLIIGPWNYPFQLVIAPLVAALAAGNCVVVKPSEQAPRTSALTAEIITSIFDPAYVAVIEGAVEETQALLQQRFDYIFFTGGAAVGRIVMAAAAHHLTPVTLELGGKNPCLVARDADLALAARRIVWGKFFNAGQTCIAPDFVLVDAAAKPALLAHLKNAVEAFYGKDPRASPDYGRIVNDRHFARLVALLANGNVLFGGETDAATRYIAPTVIDDVAWDDIIMQEEIFGPILPVLACEDLSAAIEQLEHHSKPLALYIFSSNRTRQNDVLTRLSAGGVCINDTLSQFLNLRLPFGGVGQSGMGAYHGKAGFDTFSHHKSVVRRGTWIDPTFRYPPYKTSLGVLRRVLRFIQ